MHYQPKDDLLAHRIILVTGASDGIGREAALTYARFGAEVILLGRSAEKLQQTEALINQLNKRPAHSVVLIFQTPRRHAVRS